MIPYRVSQIANNVRNWTEKNREKLECPHYDLCGLCAVASAELFRRLKKYDPSMNVVLALAEDLSFGHVYVIYDDRIIIDVTATQFADEYLRVEIRKVSMFNPWYWKHIKTFDSDEDLHYYQVGHGWSTYQQANTHRIQKRKHYRARARSQRQRVAA